MGYGMQCINAAHTFPISKLNRREKNTYLAKTGELVRYFLLIHLRQNGGVWYGQPRCGSVVFHIRDEVPLGMAVALEDRQNSENDASRMCFGAPEQIMLCFWAIISATIIRNSGVDPKDLQSICVQIKKQTREDRSSEGQRISHTLEETRQRSCDKLFTTDSYCKLRAMSEA